MKLPEKTMDNHLAEVAQRLPADIVTVLRDIECVADVFTSGAILHFKSGTDSDYPHRPYLHFIGECRRLTGDLSNGVKELEFKEQKGIPVDMFYEFSNQEIAEMALKGLFNQGFECPDIFIDNMIEVPVRTTLCVVATSQPEDVPIIFADIVDRKGVDITEATCGYRFGDYFEATNVDSLYIHDQDEPMMFDTWEVEKYFEPEEELSVEEIQPIVETSVELDSEETRIARHVKNVAQRVLSRIDEQRTEKKIIDKKGLKDKPDLYEMDNDDDSNYEEVSGFEDDDLLEFDDDYEATEKDDIMADVIRKRMDSVEQAEELKRAYMGYVDKYLDDEDEELKRAYMGYVERYLDNDSTNVDKIYDRFNARKVPAYMTKMEEDFGQDSEKDDDYIEINDLGDVL